MSETTAVPSVPQPARHGEVADAPRAVARSLTVGATLVLVGLVVLLVAVYVGLTYEVQAVPNGPPVVCSENTGICSTAFNAGPWLALAGAGLVAWGGGLLLSSLLEIGRRSDRAVGAVEKPPTVGPFAVEEERPDRERPESP